MVWNTPPQEMIFILSRPENPTQFTPSFAVFSGSKTTTKGLLSSSVLPHKEQHCYDNRPDNHELSGHLFAEIGVRH